jgi:hypothetical protein
MPWFVGTQPCIPEVGGNPIGVVTGGPAGINTMTNVINLMSTANADQPSGPGGYSFQGGPEFDALYTDATTWPRLTPWWWAFANTLPAGVSVQIRHQYLAVAIGSTPANAVWSVIVAGDTFGAQVDQQSAPGTELSASPGLQNVTDGTGGEWFTPATGQVVQVYQDQTAVPVGTRQCVYSEIQARLIVTPGWTGPDNRAGADIVGGAGGDWWGSSNLPFASGGFLKLTSAWQAMCAWTGPQGFTPTWPYNQGAFPYKAGSAAGWTIAQLQANPPPLNYMGS